MTHPYEEDREMKALKDDIDMLDFVMDAECGIPTRCPCWGGGGNHQRGVQEKVQMLRKRVDVMAAEITELKYKLNRLNPTSP
ncbi:hypothetical protein IGI04_036136 [Brassica rapa subsp. trilocularis]|uniref:Uncharacterized protein n=1 Tax=Brassica rapa subsp. trilocularis TaxID=1813537 RepID=A0ABQ7LHH3_BRACM|nr:hypothetical protein IGI04_036136 [Brassica rapa subsp. trilocularis]